MSAGVVLDQYFTSITFVGPWKQAKSNKPLNIYATDDPDPEKWVMNIADGGECHIDLATTPFDNVETFKFKKDSIVITGSNKRNTQLLRFRTSDCLNFNEP